MIATTLLPCTLPAGTEPAGSLGGGDAAAASVVDFTATFDAALAARGPATVTGDADFDPARAALALKVPTDVVCFAPRAPDAGRDAPDDAASPVDPTAPDAAADLAAQLAIVAQWSALPAPTSPPTPTMRRDESTPANAKAAGLAPRARADGSSLDTRVASASSDPPSDAPTAQTVHDRFAALRASRAPTPDATPDVASRAVATDGDAPARRAAIDAGAAVVAPSVAVPPTVVAPQRAERRDDPATIAVAPSLATRAAPSDDEPATVSPVATHAGEPAVPTSALSFAAAVATAHASSSLATPASAQPPDALRQPVGTPEWSRELGHAAVRVATTSLKEAQLVLNPEHLGPLDVRVRIDDGVAHVAFQAAHADTRHALEASRAVLDQLFATQGLALGAWSIADAPARDASGQRGDSSTTSTGGDASNAHAGRSSDQRASPERDGSARAATVRYATPLGLVDTFA